jgi:DNA replication and repair protein RecF
LCLTKSYFNTTDAANISNGLDYFVLDGHFVLNNEQSQIVCKQPSKGKKEFSRNRVIYDKLAEHIGRFPAVMITPYDVDLIQEGSEVRRRFLDAAISQVDNTYLQNLMLYQKIVVQRNALLKQLAERHGLEKNLLAVLDMYDVQMVQYGTPIIQKRQAFIPSFLIHFEEYYKWISSDREQVNVQYESTLLAHDFASSLAANRSADIAAQRTLVGLHRDDLLFTLNDLLLKKFGSQGQQKSFLLALKFAQWQLTFQTTGKQPLLLLDDLFDRMDEQRIRNLVSLFPQFGQLFLTDTHAERLHEVLVSVGLDFESYAIG